MNSTRPESDSSSELTEQFSLVLGGPLFQLFRRAWLTGDHLELVARRMVAMTVIAWVPLLILSMLDGKAWGTSIRVPFLLDVDAHVRFLVALPLLIAAELVVHGRMRPVVSAFRERGLVPEASNAGFEAALRRALRLRNSLIAELSLLAIVYVVGVFIIWRQHLALAVPTWYATPVDGGLRPVLAGYWYAYVSLPLFQFILIRWYFRLFIWARFLWDVSRLGLVLTPTHPDRAGGLGFLSNIVFAFAPLLFAQGAILSGMMANRVLYDGAKLPDFKLEMFFTVAVFLATVLGPLLVFSPTLEKTRRRGLGEYGMLAQRYVAEFDEKWIRGGAPPGEPLVGSADIQSLADLGNSFEVVRGMRIVPFSPRTIVQLAIMTLLPVGPLLLTMISTEELIDRVVGILF